MAEAETESAHFALQLIAEAAPHFEHSALTPAGAEFRLEPEPRKIEEDGGVTLVAATLGQKERTNTDCMRSVSVGRLVSVFERVP